MSQAAATPAAAPNSAPGTPAPTKGAPPDPKGGGSASSASDPAKTPAASSSTAGTATASPAGTPDQASPAAEAKPDRIAKRAAWLAEQQAALEDGRKSHKTEVEKFTAERQAWEAEAAPWREGRKLVAEGKQLAAAAKFGLDPQKLVEEALAEFHVPTDEERAAAEEQTLEQKIEAKLKAKEEAEKKERENAEKKAAEERTAAEQQAVTGYQETIEQAYAANAAEFELIAVHEYTAADIWNRVHQKWQQEAIAFLRAGGDPKSPDVPKIPTPIEALRQVEKDLEERARRTKKLSTAPAAETPEDKTTVPPARAKTPPPTTRSSVPVADKPRPKSRAERLAEAKRAHGIG